MQMHHLQVVSGATVHHCISDGGTHAPQDDGIGKTIEEKTNSVLRGWIHRLLNHTKYAEGERKRRIMQPEIKWRKSHKSSCSRTSASIPDAFSLQTLHSCGVWPPNKTTLPQSWSRLQQLFIVCLSLCHRTPARPQSCPQVDIAQWLPLCSLDGTFPSEAAPSHAVFSTR